LQDAKSVLRQAPAASSPSRNKKDKSGAGQLLHHPCAGSPLLALLQSRAEATIGFAASKARRYLQDSLHSFQAFDFVYVFILNRSRFRKTCV
jgi:hypothetical protein